MKTNGVEIPSHKHKIAINVVKGMAPELPLFHKIKFIRKKMPKTKPETRKADKMTWVFHFSPPKVL